MKLRFSGETIDFPPPVAAAGECVIAPESFVTVDIPMAGSGERNLTLFNLRKVLFFAFREGISLTLSKIRAVLAHRKLGRSRSLVIAVGVEPGSGRRAIAFGGQDCAEAELLCFPKSSVMVEGAAPLDTAAATGALCAYCAENPDSATAIRDWSRFSGEPPPIGIEDAMATGRTVAEPPPVPKATAVSFPEAGDAWQPAPPAGGPTALFLAGGGTYPCAYALPIFVGAKIPFDTVIELNPVRAAQVAARFGFAYADTDAARGLQRLAAYEEPILVIATYHSTHVDIAEAALAVNPKTRIMLEKPPVTTAAQLQRLETLRRDGAYIEIGFNRRHIPMSIRARDLLSAQSGPVVMTCIVKELVIPPSHWYHWPAQGTRITGNVCHWLDLGQYFIAAKPETMSVLGPVADGRNDDVSIVVRYRDGSRLHIVATDKGSSLRGVQEYIELRRADTTIVIDDFLRMRVMSGARESVRRQFVRDKGHRRMYARFMRNIEAGEAPGYPGEDLTATATQYLRASEAFASGRPTSEIDLGDGKPV
jgi:predicted dehydrogenase